MSLYCQFFALLDTFDLFTWYVIVWVMAAQTDYIFFLIRSAGEHFSVSFRELSAVVKILKYYSKIF